jgi:hypothetical protein
VPHPAGQRMPDDDSKDTVIGVVGDAHVNALNDDDAVEGYFSPAWKVRPASSGICMVSK